MTVLRHIHLPSWPRASPPRFPHYALAVAVQTELQQRLLAWKAAAAAAAAAANSANPPPPPPPPPPTLLTFTPAPTYTLGRRQTAPLSAPELARLRKPLAVRYVDTRNNNNNSYSAAGGDDCHALEPAVARAPRGGLATYHGPGQVVFWPVVDLRSPLHGRGALSVCDYARLLEETTIAALARAFGIRGLATSNPGVWVRRGEGEEEEQEEERKIAALGVHLRRHVTGLGVAVNVAMPTTTTASGGLGESANPWARIVACGLGDKGVTSVAAELLSKARGRGADAGAGAGVGGDVRGGSGSSVEALCGAVTSAWAREFAARLGLDGVEDVLKWPADHDQNAGQWGQREDWTRLGHELDLESLRGAADGYATAESSGPSVSGAAV